MKIIINFAVLILILAGASGVVYYQQSVFNTRLSGLQSQIDQANAKSNKTETPKIVNNTQSNILFSNCNSDIGSLSQYDWFQTFTEISTPFLSKIGAAGEVITNTCYSENGKILILITHGIGGDTPSIYKFNIVSKTIEPAIVVDKGELIQTPMNEFGVQVGDVLKMNGQTGDAGVSLENFYDYNFVNNTVVLKKTVSKFEAPDGSTQSSTVEY